MPRFLRFIAVASALTLAAGCACRAERRAEVATFEAIASRFAGYSAADPALDASQRELDRLLVEVWAERLGKPVPVAAWPEVPDFRLPTSLVFAPPQRDLATWTVPPAMAGAVILPPNGALPLYGITHRGVTAEPYTVPAAGRGWETCD